MSELEKMEFMLQEMSGQMQAMQEYIKEQSLEITALKKSSKGTESVISKGMLKEIEDTKKIAKEAVPKLTVIPDNFKVWDAYL